MSAKLVNHPAPVQKPAPPLSEAEPAGDRPEVFPSCAELGEQLRRLGQVQAAIDRRAAEELARLRAIQDRD
jgi:hypothetical protein